MATNDKTLSILTYDRRFPYRFGIVGHDNDTRRRKLQSARHAIMNLSTIYPTAKALLASDEQKPFPDKTINQFYL